MKRYNEIRTRNGQEDDIVVSEADIHLEDMDGKNWWMGVYKGDKRATFWMSSQSKITVRTDENDLNLPFIEQNSLLKSK